MKVIGVTQVLQPSGKRASIPVSIPDELYDTASQLEIVISLINATTMRISAWRRGGSDTDQITEYADKGKGNTEANDALIRLIKRFQK